MKINSTRYRDVTLPLQYAIDSYVTHHYENLMDNINILLESRTIFQHASVATCARAVTAAETQALRSLRKLAKWSIKSKALHFGTNMPEEVEAKLLNENENEYV